MSDKQAKLAAALKKKANDDEAPPPPLAPIAPQPDRDTLKLRNSNLRGIVTWEQALEQIALNTKADFTELHATITKMFGNVIGKPGKSKTATLPCAHPYA